MGVTCETNTNSCALAVHVCLRLTIRESSRQSLRTDPPPYTSTLEYWRLDFWCCAHVPENENIMRFDNVCRKRVIFESTTKANATTARSAHGG